MVGLGLTHNESLFVGWYKSKITCEPEPKPTRTGATLHSLAVADGLLAGYKLDALTFGGKNMSIWGCSRNCSTIKK
jgi:hypothetical protein